MTSVKKEYGLTGREKEILQHLVNGMSKKHIASHLHLSLFTVDTHLKNICAKLDGTYLGTLISPGGEFGRGSFYGFMKTHQSACGRLHLIKRLDKDRGEMAEFVSK